MIIRVGRRTPQCLYLQAGCSPDHGVDLFLGAARSAAGAALLADSATCGLAHHPQMLVEYFASAEVEAIQASDATRRLAILALSDDHDLAQVEAILRDARARL